MPLKLGLSLQGGQIKRISRNTFVRIFPECIKPLIKGTRETPILSNNTTLKDYFITEGGETFAGKHVLLELWEAQHLTDPGYIEESLKAGAIASGAVILHSHLHHFSPYGGVTGVLLLAESHISIHTWPERSYAAIDIFMCGACDPEVAARIIADKLSPARQEMQIMRRGIVAPKA